MTDSKTDTTFSPAASLDDLLTLNESEFMRDIVRGNVAIQSQEIIEDALSGMVG